MHPSPKALVAVLFAALAACNGAPSTTDAGDTGTPSTDAVDMTVRDVVNATDAVDTADAGALFGPCTGVAQCPGTQATCISETQGYPGGYCSRRCTNDTQCGPNGTCQPFGSMMLCLQSCSFPTDCRDGYNCFTFSGTQVQVCLPQCSSDTQCAPSHCDVYQGFCGATNTALGDNGTPCTGNSGCRSNRCITEIDSMGNPSGNLDGYCYSLCAVASADQYAGSTLPMSTCPSGSVCIGSQGATQGDIGFCYAECTSNTECRDGYVCVHPNNPSGTAYTNGYCAAMNCHYMTQTCPAGTSCLTTQTNSSGMPTNGVCERVDGGVDAGNDAADVGSDAIEAAADVEDAMAGDASDVSVDAGVDVNVDVDVALPDGVGLE